MSLCIDLFGVITFRVRHSRGEMEMYIGHGRLFVCLSLAAFPHYCADPDVTRGNGRGCALVVQHWTALQSLHRFRCYDSIHVCKLIALYTANTYSAEFEIAVISYVSFITSVSFGRGTVFSAICLSVCQQDN